MQTVPLSVDLSRGKAPKDFFQCQISDPSEVEKWHASAALKDYTIPSSNWCALTTLRAALLLERGEALSMEELFEDACHFGVYVLRADKPGWAGARHIPLVSFFCRHGLPARYETGLNSQKVSQALAKRLYVIPSLDPAIRYHDRAPYNDKKGHFVFMFGYSTDSNGILRFRLNNSSGFASLNSQVDFRVSAERFDQLFSGNAILVRAKPL